MASTSERGISISQAKKQEKSGVIPANPAVRKLVEVVAAVRNPHILAYNLENLEQVEEDAKAGKKVMVALNHLSNWDHSAYEQALERNGFGAFRRRNVYPLGISLQKNRWAQVVNRMVPTVNVWPSAFPAAPGEERLKQEMNYQGAKTITRERNEGKNIVIYPEASRGTKPEIEPLDVNVHGYFREPNMVILPVALTGTEIVLPKGAWWPRPYPVTVTFGNPLYTDELLQQYADLPRDEKGKRILNDTMTEVARNLPECYQGIFAGKV